MRWTSLVNAIASANTITKSAGCGGCDDSGAISQQKIASGDGYVQFTAAERDPLRFVGLSVGNSGTSAGEIKFAIRLQSGRAEVRESGVYRSETGFAAGDTFRVAVEGGQVKYSKNGAVFYTSASKPAYPLIVDSTLFDLGAKVTSATFAPASGSASLAPAGDTDLVPATTVAPPARTSRGPR